MKFDHPAIKPLLVVAFALLLSTISVAQEKRSEISVEGMGLFNSNNTTDSGGLLFGYRFNVNSWLAAEANYGFTRNRQGFFGPQPTSVESDMHEITGAGVLKLPIFPRLRPFVLAGGGVLVFDPTDRSLNFPGASQETVGTFLYGVGVDYRFASHWAIRAQYRGLVYEAPSFNVVGARSGDWEHIAQPSAGIVLRF